MAVKVFEVVEHLNNNLTENTLSKIDVAEEFVDARLSDGNWVRSTVKQTGTLQTWKIQGPSPASGHRAAILSKEELKELHNRFHVIGWRYLITDVNRIGSEYIWVLTVGRYIVP